MNSRSCLKMFALAAMVVPSLSFAALGGDISSVQTDREQMKATLRVARAETRYTVHEIQTPSGTAVREYTNANGTVFGVAWNGPVIPNLRQLLGQQNFDTFTQSAKNSRAGHSQRLVQQSGLVVHSSGHMRAFAGHAYLADMLPQGVTAKDIL